MGPLFRTVDTAEHPSSDQLYATLQPLKCLLLGLSPVRVLSQMQNHPARQGLDRARVRVPRGGLGHLSVGVPARPRTHCVCLWCLWPLVLSGVACLLPVT